MPLKPLLPAAPVSIWITVATTPVLPMRASSRNSTFTLPRCGSVSGKSSCIASQVSQYAAATVGHEWPVSRTASA
jgi:hypothetical protein